MKYFSSYTKKWKRKKKRKLEKLTKKIYYTAHVKIFVVLLLSCCFVLAIDKTDPGASVHLKGFFKCKHGQFFKPLFHIFSFFNSILKVSRLKKKNSFYVLIKRNIKGFIHVLVILFSKVNYFQYKEKINSLQKYNFILRNNTF